MTYLDLLQICIDAMPFWVRLMLAFWIVCTGLVLTFLFPWDDAP